VSNREAEKESVLVAGIRANCISEAARIKAEKDACEADLAKAQPFVDDAIAAINSIKAAHITEVRSMKRPSDIIRVVFDGVLILFHGQIAKAAAAELNIDRKAFEFIAPSWSQATILMGDTNFLKYILEFPKDNINGEVQRAVHSHASETHPPSHAPVLCRRDHRASAAVRAAARVQRARGEGRLRRRRRLVHLGNLHGRLHQRVQDRQAGEWALCCATGSGRSPTETPYPLHPWCTTFGHAQKLEALQIAQGQLALAQQALNQAEERMARAEARKKELSDAFNVKMAEKRKIEEGARLLKKRAEQASNLIQALQGERERWSDDSANFAAVKRQLLGDCAVASAFISYCGAFNAPFRQYLVNERFIRSARKRSVPVTGDLDVTSFLVDVGTVGDWNLQGLPTDSLSVQNGILVTRSSRYPLLVDPQGQALQWIRTKAQKENKLPLFGTTTLGAKDLRDQLEFTMSEGLAMIVVGVEEEIDPLLDPVLSKQYIKRGRSQFVTVSDKQMAVHPEFQLFFITRLPNPHLSPELQAKVGDRLHGDDEGEEGKWGLWGWAGRCGTHPSAGPFAHSLVCRVWRSSCWDASSPASRRRWRTFSRKF